MTEPHPYTITIEFTTDRYLSPEERHNLLAAVLAQVEDPAPLNEDERRADFTTRIVKGALEGQGYSSKHVAIYSSEVLS